MKTVLLALLALCGLLASPALGRTNSNFVGPRIEASINDNAKVGVGAGLDIPLGDRLTLGAEASSLNAFNRDRNVSVGGRVGFAVHPNLLVYGAVGYDDYRYRNFDGVRYGGGIQIAVAKYLYTKAGYQRGRHGNDSGTLALGLRF